MKRHGALVKFKPGTTSEQAAEALAKIADVLDMPETYTDYDAKPTGLKGNMMQFPERPYTTANLVHEFDDKYGGPVWYIP